MSETTIGPYRLGGLLGRGGTGSVHRAMHEVTGHVVALKQLHRHQGAYQASMRREIDVLSSLQHPGVVQIVEYGMDGETPWVAMELIEGTPLTAHLVTRRVMSTLDLDLDLDLPTAGTTTVEAGSIQVAPEVRRALGYLLHTLDWLHGEGLVHRDVKPDNVVLVDGQAVLVDFGLATHMGARERLDRLSGGTPGYVAPEQAQGLPVDGRADLYAFGCMVYEAFTGRLPGTDPDPLDDPELDAIVRPLLAKVPSERLLHKERLAAVLGVDAFGPPPRLTLQRPTFVGRPDILRQRNLLLERGHGALLLTGEHGIGKSRAALEIAREARRRGWRTQARHGSAGLAAFVAFVRAAAHRWDADDERLDEGAALAALARHLDLEATLPEPGSLPPEASRTRRCDGLRAALAHLARDARPLCLFVDDLHAANTDTVDALAAVARATHEEGLPVVLLATWNQGERPIPPVLLDAFDQHEDLGELPSDAVATLLRSASRRPLTTERVTSLVDHAHGNPSRALDHLRAEGAGLHERLSALSPAARDLVALASIAEPSDLAQLGRVAGLTGPPLAWALHETRRSGFLDVRQGHVVFGQAGLRRRALEDMSEAHRRSLHARLARHAGGARRARHLEQADRPAEAQAAWHAELLDADGSAERSLAALRRLQALGATLGIPLRLRHAELEHHAGRVDACAKIAAAVADEADEVEHRIRARLLLARSLPRSQPEAWRAVADAVSMSRATSSQHLAWEARFLAIRMRLRAGRIEEPEACDLYEDLLREVDAQQGRLRGLILVSLAGALLYRGRAAQAREVLQQALCHQESMDTLDRCRLYGNLGAAAWQLGDTTAGLEHTLTNLRLAARDGALRTLAVAMMNVGLTVAADDQRQAAERLLGGALRIGLHLDDASLLVGGLTRVIDARLLFGTAQVQLAQRITQVAEPVADAAHLSELRFRLARLQAQGGADEASRALLEQVQAGRDDPGDLGCALDLLSGKEAHLPQTTEACMLLVHRTTDRRLRAHAASVLADHHARTRLLAYGRVAEAAGARGLPASVRLAPVSARIDALGIAVENVLAPAIERLESLGVRTSST